MSQSKLCISRCFFDRYMRGQCPAFALALHEVYGLPIETIFDPYSETGHFYCLVGEENVLDCRGLIPKADIIKDFGSPEAVFTRYSTYDEAVPEALAWLDFHVGNLPKVREAIDEAKKTVVDNSWLYSPKPEVVGRDFSLLFDVLTTNFAHEFTQEEIDNLISSGHLKYKRSGQLVLQAKGKELLRRFSL